MMGETPSPSQLACALETVGYGVLMTSAQVEDPGPIITFVNTAMCDLTGFDRDELVGATPRILQGPDTDRDELNRLRLAMNENRSFRGDAINYRKDGTSYVVDWMINPIFDDQGVIEGWISVQRDVTQRRRDQAALRENEERLQVLVAELQHRTRNLMSVVRAMTTKALRSSANLEDFAARFKSRLEALARAQGLLSRLSDGGRVTFDELIHGELAILNGERGKVATYGPGGVRLRSTSVQALAMALHELTTNAQKHGALGQDGGQVDIRWSCERRGPERVPWLRIDWHETGVVMRQPSPASSGTGEGRSLIEHALSYQFGAETSFTLNDDGVRCIISIPVSASNSS